MESSLHDHRGLQLHVGIVAVKQHFGGIGAVRPLPDRLAGLRLRARMDGVGETVDLVEVILVEEFQQVRGP